MAKRKPALTDRERILTNILLSLVHTQYLCLRATQEEKFKEVLKEYGLREYVHFGGFDDRPLCAGDLVIEQTGKPSEWTVAWVEKVYSPDNVLVREIGSNRLCNYENGRFIRIAGMRTEKVVDGGQYKFYEKLDRALEIADDFHHRLVSVEFPDKRTCRVSMMNRYGRLSSHQYAFDINFNSKTTIKQIVKLLEQKGIGLAFQSHIEIMCKICNPQIYPSYWMDKK